VTPQQDGVPLAGGRMTSGIVRHGGRVRRPAGSWTPAVHEYLRHLAAAGFEGSPRVLEAGDGWELLTYLDGEVAVDPDWQPGRGNRLPPYARTDEALVTAECVKYWPIDASGAATSLEFLARELRWIHRLAPDLARAL
jgi:hypothetical protein